MPGQDALREFYPAILSLTLKDVERLSQGDPQVHAYLLRIYHDLLRARERTQFEGWTYKHNPFTSIDLSGWMPPVFTDVMQTQYDMTLRANEWFGIGMWNLAEEYYKIAISLALVSNDVIAALQNGANLALCYLGSDDCRNAFRICAHLQPAAIQTQNTYGTEVLHQTGTITRMCLVKTRRYDLVAQETKRLRGISSASSLLSSSPDFGSLDVSIFRIIADVFQSIGHTDRLQIWQNEWRQLQDLVKTAA